MRHALEGDFSIPITRCNLRSITSHGEEKHKYRSFWLATRDFHHEFWRMDNQKYCLTTKVINLCIFLAMTYNKQVACSGQIFF